MHDRDARNVAAILLFGRSMNTSTERHQQVRDVVPLLRWVLTRGDEAVTCQVNAHADRRTADVSVLPHSKIRAGAVLAVPSTCDALLLHAHIASRLKDAGWRVVCRF